MNLTPKQTIKGTVTETQGLNGSLKDIPSVKGSVAETQSLRGSMKDIPSLDNTLTKEGYAADAKAVGEALDSKAPISHTEDKGNPHGVTASQVGARPDTWMPSASEIGARPDTWMPTASDVGARANTWTPTAQEVGARPDDWMPTAEQVGARPDTWTPTAEDVGARPNTWMPTADDVGARANTWMPTAEDVGARPNTWTPTAAEVGAKPNIYEYPSVNGGDANTYTEETHLFVFNMTNLPSELGGDWCHGFFDVFVATGSGYSLTSNKPVIKQRFITYSDFNCIAWRTSVDGGLTWSIWEFDNPPMSIGTEYRTTKRFDGKHVYTKAFNTGNLPINTSATIAHGIKNVDKTVSVRGYITGLGASVTIPYYDATNNWIGITFQRNNYTIATGHDASSFTAVLIAEYTKTTD
jgi:hypothetical protein